MTILLKYIMISSRRQIKMYIRRRGAKRKRKTLTVVHDTRHTSDGPRARQDPRYRSDLSNVTKKATKSYTTIQTTLHSLPNHN